MANHRSFRVFSQATGIDQAQKQKSKVGQYSLGLMGELMRSKRKTWTGVLALSLVLSGGVAESYAQGDPRNMIVLRPKERTDLLANMRNYLRAVQQISAGVAAEDHKAIEHAARGVGNIAIYEMKPVMANTLVPLFRSLAVSVHNDFEKLAEDAAAKKPPLELLGQLSRTMNKCVTCHDTFKIGEFSHNKQ